MGTEPYLDENPLRKIYKEYEICIIMYSSIAFEYVIRHITLGGYSK